MGSANIFGHGWGRRVACGALTLLVAACATYGAGPTDLGAFARRPPLSAPADNPTTPAKVALGARLFADVRLSGDNSLSCASCHRPDHGFEDGRPRAIGIDGRQGTHATPTLLGVGSAPRLMWDGRVRSLEAQALLPIAHPDEMGQHLATLPAELAADAGLRAEFASAFPASPAVALANIARALAAYQRTIRSGEAPFDRFVAGDAGALTPSAIRGFALFTGKGGCARCHSGPLLTDGRRHDIGLPDEGRGMRFKTPTLRDLGSRAPYMHDGSLATLDAVIDHYAGAAIRRRGVPAAVHLDTAERSDLRAFLQALDARPRAS